MKRLYIGGSPCSGKSTIAERLAAANGLAYHSIDEDMEPGMRRAAQNPASRCAAYFNRTPDGVWLREPEEQEEDETGIYEEIFEYTMEALIRLPAFIAEGAGFLPRLMAEKGITPEAIIYITPSPDFQLREYAKRTWTGMIVKDCSDPDEAFRRWMERDILFAEHIRREAAKYGYKSLVTDGTRDLDEMYSLTAAHFGLK